MVFYSHFNQPIGHSVPRSGSRLFFNVSQKRTVGLYGLNKHVQLISRALGLDFGINRLL